MHVSRFLVRLATLLLLMVGAIAVPVMAAAQADLRCEQFPETGQESCDAFLSYWEHNGGLPVFGMPLTAEFSELSADTLAQQEVQYYERERFELHPENEGTPYIVLLGRLGVDLLAFNGIDWMSLPKASPNDAHYMANTGQAIAPEFWKYWSSHGLDFGDAGVSFRESLALFGFPVTPTELETNADGDTVLTQWYERARFELHDDGTVLLGRLGAAMNESDGQFAIRVQLEFETAMQLAFDDHEARGTVASVQVPGVGEWFHSIGQANPDTGTPYTRDTHHRIGSVTKTFTGTMVLQLVDQELLDLDATVDQWFDGMPNGDQITVRMLLNMTSGLADFTVDQVWLEALFADPYKVWAPEAAVEWVEGQPVLFEPGEGWNYSNPGTIMLGLIIEDVTGKPIRTVLQEQVLDPLGMDNTSFPENDDVLIPEPYARGVTRDIVTGEQRDATNWNPSWGWTAGQMISTLEDLQIWARALGTGELLSAELIAERDTWVPVVPLYSYGLGIANFDGWVGHNGAIPGYNSDNWYRTDLDATILVFANSETMSEETNTLPADAVFNGLRTILNREYQLPSATQ